YETFEENIIYAKGMANVKKMVNRHIMPTPGSVMESTLKLKEELGNIMTIDVGGATTDIHSVSLPSEDFLEYLEGEPLSKRTVEGDLGVFINHENVLKNFNQADLLKELTIDKTTFSALINNYSYIPKTPMQRKLVFALTKKCVNLALDRHVGDLRRVFTTSGQKIIPEGKDLSQVETIVLTGGALINLKDTESIIRDYIKKNKTKMMPSNNVKIVKDHNYIMASMGVLSLVYPKEAMDLLKQSLRM
ncbi:MAG: glutamate mutase L, partial [Candidatus Izimaplasma sp.]|nr:glutamate mutase L [Candidatus Izimaplasma bacterium]